jgi:hypothetical protein
LLAGANDIDNIDDINNINDIDNIDDDKHNIDDAGTVPRPMLLDVFERGLVTPGKYLHRDVPRVRAAARRMCRRRSG